MGIRTDFSDVPLAIIGMGCRLPAAENLDQYWELISQGRSAIAEVPADRLDQSLYYHPDKGVRGKTYSKVAALLPEGPLDFDRYPIPLELRQAADPMHLVMTAVAADALRQGGLDPFRVPLKNTGVFIGHAVGSDVLRNWTYAAHLQEALALLEEVPGFKDLPPRQQETFFKECRERLLNGLGETPLDGRPLHCSMVAGTVSKAFGLTGPFLALNSACASSLHAMLMGARALQEGRVDMVIAGGASHCTAHTLVLFSAAQAMSSNASRPFDADADGLIMSEGYVAVVMKTLERALADGDPIQAVVRGLGVATDGRGKSLWAPRKEGQIKAMRQAYRSGVDMSGLQYLECHATATQLGDATELETLGEVLGPKMPPGKQIAITSVKANIGHALEAAGVAGLIKTVLSMQHETIPPAINIERLNPKIDWKSAPFYIPRTAQHWTPPADGQPRRAAVNAFGIGGLNMHVVLDQFSEPYHRQLLAAGRPQTRAASVDHNSGTNGHDAAHGGRNGESVTADDKAIAIIGMGCIFPGAEGITKFWETLASGIDPKTAPAEPRWTPIALANANGHPFVGGFVTDFQYNWRKHKVPPKQVAEADPLQFMFLEAAEQALADAGYDKKPLDRERCGVMVGTEFGGEFSDHLEMGLRLPEMTHVFSQLLARRGVPAERIEEINKRYCDILLKKWPSLIDETGSFTTSTLASRISKTLDLAGGAVAIDSGSTSALSGLSICVDMLLSGDNDMMICAAGQRRMGLNAFRAMQNDGRLASGEPRSILDAGYDGIVPGEGVGVVILKRLADARRDGDRVHAVLRGIGVAHHESHAEALRLAVERSSAMADIDPSEVSVGELETDEQLTGGAELETLAAMHASGERRGPFTLASGTAQLGHLGGASGMAALIKASLEIEHGETAPTAGLAAPAVALGPWKHAVAVNPGPTKLTGRRLVGISCWSYGLACHLILEHAAPVVPQTTATKAQPARVAAGPPARQTLSARPQVASHSRVPAHAMAGHSAGPQPAMAHAAANHSVANHTASNHTASKQTAPVHAASSHAPPARAGQSGAGLPSRPVSPARPATAVPTVTPDWQICRLAGKTSAEVLSAIDRVLADPTNLWRAVANTHFAATDTFRLAVVADSATALADKLRLARPQLDNLAARNVLEQQGIFYRQKPATRPQVAFVFPGQGSQYSGMLRPLIESVPAAGQALKEIDGTMASLGQPTFAQLAWSADDRLGQDVWTTQVSMLLADSLLLAALADRGVTPDVVLGHSYGEFVALYAAGAWDFATAVRMTQARCQGIEAAVAGGETGMLATDATPDLIEQISSGLGLDLYVANLNAPDQCVVGGTRTQLAELAASLSAQGRHAKMLAVPGAFHTPLLSSASRPLEEALRTAAIATPTVKFVSTVNNSVIGDPTEIRRNLARQLTTPVRYAQLISRLAAETPTVFVEVGPQQTLSRLNRRILGATADVIASDNPKRTGWEPLLGVQALLECLGACGAGATKVQPTVQPVAAKPAVGRAPQPEKTSAPLTPTKGTSALSDRSSTNDEIPHFDATERRREKMRTANGPHAKPAVPTAKVAVPAAKPAVPAAKPAVPAAKPAVPAAKVVASAAKVAAPAAKVTLAAAKPTAPPATPAVPSARTTAPAAKLAPAPRAAAPAPKPAAAKPNPPAAKPTPITPQPAHGLSSGNGSTNGSTGHHAAQPVASAQVSTTGTSQNSGTTSPGKSAAELEAFLINFVVEQTGYPAEVVDLDADLEADLGIDSIKKAQLFGELQEHFDISSLAAGGASGGNLSLDDFTTLRHVLEFLINLSPSGTGSTTPSAATNVHHAASAAPPRLVAAPATTVALPAAAPTAEAPANGSPGTSPAELEAFLINFVVEQTGYPAEVVDLDADLEADLGIDSIKKAQLFGELQEYFDISSLAAGGASGGNLSLDDFTTLRHVLEFLVNLSPSGASNTTPSAATNGHHAASAAPPPFAATPPPAPQAAPRSAAEPTLGDGPGTSPAELEAFLINFVVEQTGYPAEVVDLDADLEADLGIDSIKKAQLFGELQEYFDISALANGAAAGGSLSLDDFTTLRHVLDFLVQSQSGAATAGIEQVFATSDPAPAVAALTQPAPAAATHDVAHTSDAQSQAAPIGDSADRASELEAFLINFVVEQTGYPAEVVDLDADLEADLGIDSIKKAQLFGELQEYFDISSLAAGGASSGNLSLDDFTTLRHVLNFLLQADSDSSSAGPTQQTVPPTAEHAANRNGSPTNGVYVESPTLSTADVTEPDGSLSLTGTPYEIGWQHGTQFKAEIRRILRHYADCVEDQLDELPSQGWRSAPEQVLSADELDELQGLADAVEVPLGNILAHQFALTSELGNGAGQLSASLTANGHAQAIHAFRQPAPLVGALRSTTQATVFARRPTGEIAHLAVTYIGSVALLGGINAAGLAVTAYPLDGKPARATGGLPYAGSGGVTASTVVRTLLGSAATVDQAIELAQSLAVAGGQPWAALVSHATEENSAALEFDGHHSKIQKTQQTIALGQLGLPTSGGTLVSVDVATLAADWAAGDALGPGDVTAGRKLAPAGGSECLALVVEPAEGNLWLAGSAADGQIARCWSTGQALPAWDGAAPMAPAVGRAGQDSPPAALPPHPITSRFSLEMREAPLPPGSPAEPAWTGQAIVLGSGPVAEALHDRMERSGVVVHMLSADSDADTALAELEEICRSGPAPHLFLTTACDCRPIDPHDLEQWEQEHHATMMLPFLVCQKWTELAIAGNWLDRATLAATTALGGDFGFSRGAEVAQGGSLAGLLKAIFVEYGIMQNLKNLRIKVVDAPLGAPADLLAAQVLAELASDSPGFEVAYVVGRRLVSYAVDRPLAQLSGAPLPGVVTRPGSGVRHGSTWVVTGGARGITAAAALEFGKRFGLKLHLLGTTPLTAIDPTWRTLTSEAKQKLKADVMIAARKAGKPTAQAWQRVEKDLEIDRSLCAFADAGVGVTYHACDVSDRAALAAVLDQIRAADGPIAGILHGAGVERSCRFEKKTPEIVVPTIRTKVDGTAHLMALTRRDPIRHFIVFGSISGRLGGFGQVDYSLANEMACKLLGSYRRSRPWVQAVGIHWHAWDDVGMGARPETKNILEKGGMALMPLAEGLAHLVRELAAGTPEPEVMITERQHWDRFAAGLGVVADSTAADETRLPLLGSTTSNAAGTSGEVKLDPTTDRFLIEHLLRGKPLLPVVVGLEILAEAARAASGQAVVRFRDVDMVDGLTFQDDRTAVAKAQAAPLSEESRSEGPFACRLTADFFNRKGGLIQPDRLYLSAIAETAAIAEPLEPIEAMVGDFDPFIYPEDAPIHHGPVFRGLTSGHGSDQRGTAKIIALPLADMVGPDRVAGWSIPSCVLDAAFYACAMHLWFFGGNAVALPRRVADLRLGRLPRDGEVCQVHFVCIDFETGDYDFDVVGEDGAMIVQARRYGQVIFARGVYGPAVEQ
jgi:acyl transferase domain-containing protein/acyl carrier protein